MPHEVNWIKKLNFKEIFSDYLGIPLTHNRVEVRITCCFHSGDSEPSLSLSLNTGRYYCHSCHKGGNIVQFLCDLKGLKWEESLQELKTRYSNTPKFVQPELSEEAAKRIVPPTDEYVNKCQEYLLQTPEVLDFLRSSKRGLNDDTFRKFRLGYDGERITIPVYENGKLVNIKKYKFKSDKGPKFFSWAKGYGQPRLYPDKVKGESILVVAGEWDCMIAWQMGFKAYTSTAGEGSFDDSWLPKFKGKDVIVCYDVDNAGREGAMAVANKLSAVARSVKIVYLPLPDGEKADLTDYFVKYKHSREDFCELIAQAEYFTFNNVLGDDMRDLIPPGSLLYDYVDYATQQTDAPQIFHLAVGLSVISAVVGNRIWIMSWGQRIYPSMWNLILAPSGFYRKTTSMRIGIGVLQNVVPMEILASEFTPEALHEKLSCHSTGIVPIWEFGAFLKSLDKEYNSGCKELLTELFDCGFRRRQTRKFTGDITNASVSIIAGSTLSWIVDRITKGDIESGFLCRFIFWPATTKLEDKGILTEPPLYMLDSLKNRLWKILGVEGEAILNGEVKAIYQEWVKKHEREIDDNQLPQQLHGFYTRLSTYVLKIALLYELSMSQRKEVTAEAFNYAIRLVEYLKDYIVKLICSELVTTKDGRDIKYVRDLITSSAGATKAKLLRESSMTKRRFEELLNTLIESGQVERRSGGYYILGG